MHMEMQLLKRIVFLFIFISFVFFISSLEAREPLPPRFSANAYTGVYTVGQADLLVSLDGDSQHNLYVDPQGAYGSDQQWYGDLGLGYRWIKNDAAILGGYLFAGHSRVENSSGFWIVNPGIEALGSRWDARINAYIPVAGRSNELGIKEFNIVNTPVFTGHTEVINSVFNDANAIQQVGNGADARIGYQFFHQVPLKGYIGAYFFALPNINNITGGAAGLEYWFDDNIRVFANYSYDNYQHSNVVGGLGISFGGVRKHWADPSLSERLTDPVDRYLANLGHGSGIPSKTLLYGVGSGSSSQLISNSIAFFSPNGTPNNGGAALTLANCTFEDPCGPTDFSQTGVNTLNTLLPNTDFYFNGGAYLANNVGIALTLNNGQNVYSRTTDYSALATGSTRSTFDGAFILNGNNELNGVILNNAGVAPTTAGISSGVGASNLLINNSQIGSASAPYNSGININSGSATIENSNVFGIILGVGAQDSVLTVESSQINSQGMDTIGLGIANAQAQINNSQINAFGTTGSTTIVGLNAAGNSVVNLQNSGVTAQYTSAPPAGSIGLRTQGATAPIQMTGGNLIVSGNGTSSLTSGSNITLIEVNTSLNS
ncbi:hypothetical protein [Rickettsiella endosymbiont of Aleochara curtula]|uniref:hypothetical protein n=1 Tax=Rickettsiella endosymbiont of Aleochara curtula TaxID=3077936 RepID=UPI00313E0F1B